MDGFVFRDSWWIAVKKLPKEIRAEVLEAVVEYGVEGSTTGGQRPFAEAMLTIIKAEMDKDVLADGKGSTFERSGSRHVMEGVNEKTRYERCAQIMAECAKIMMECAKSSAADEAEKDVKNAQTETGCAKSSTADEAGKGAENAQTVAECAKSSTADEAGKGAENAQTVTECVKNGATKSASQSTRKASENGSLPSSFPCTPIITKKNKNNNYNNINNIFLNSLLKEEREERVSQTQPQSTTQNTGEAEVTEKVKRFTPPTLEQVKAYWEEKQLQGTAERFFDYFTSNGWKVSGRAPMKDWQAAARNWSRNAESWGTSTKAQKNMNDPYQNGQVLAPGKTDYSNNTWEKDETEDGESIPISQITGFKAV